MGGGILCLEKKTRKIRRCWKMCIPLVESTKWLVVLCIRSSTLERSGWSTIVGKESDKMPIGKLVGGRRRRRRRRSQKPSFSFREEMEKEEGAKQHETDVALQLDPFSSFLRPPEPKRAETENRRRERERGKNKEMMKSPLQEEGERERATHVVRLGSVSEKKNLFKRGENYSHRVYF